MRFRDPMGSFPSPLPVFIALTKKICVSGGFFYDRGGGLLVFFWLRKRGKLIKNEATAMKVTEQRNSSYVFFLVFLLDF